MIDHDDLTTFTTHGAPGHPRSLRTYNTQVWRRHLAYTGITWNVDKGQWLLVLAHCWVRHCLPSAAILSTGKEGAGYRFVHKISQVYFDVKSHPCVFRTRECPEGNFINSWDEIRSQIWGVGWSLYALTIPDTR